LFGAVAPAELEQGSGRGSLEVRLFEMWLARDKRQQSRDVDKSSHAPPGPISLGARLRAYFLAGVIVTAPIGITVLLIWQFISFLDSHVASLIPERYNPETYLPFSVPGLGLLITIAFLTLVGFLAAGLAGRTLVRLGERLLSRMPVVRSVYGTLKQIFETVLAQSSRSFREVVLIEYPRRGLGAIGFVTGPTKGEIQVRSEDEMVNVFLPTTPNPTSGFLLFVPRRDLVPLDMSVEEAMKLVISGGIVTPASQLDVLAEAARSPGRVEAPEQAAAPVAPPRDTSSPVEPSKAEPDAAPATEQEDPERPRVAAR
jgi:uncharacterized membrane protein